MSVFQFNCPNCKQSLDAPIDMIGQLVDCPSCKKTIEVSRTQIHSTRPISAPARNRVNAAQKYSTSGRRPNTQSKRGSDKKVLPLFLLFIFFGGLGGHAFYAGKIGWGITYIVMILLIAIGSAIGVLEMAVLALVYSIMLIIDFVRIIIGAYPDGEKNKITQWT